MKWLVALTSLLLSAFAAGQAAPQLAANPSIWWLGNDQLLERSVTNLLHHHGINCSITGSAIVGVEVDSKPAEAYRLLKKYMSRVDPPRAKHGHWEGNVIHGSTHIKRTRPSNVPLKVWRACQASHKVAMALAGITRADVWFAKRVYISRSGKVTPVDMISVSQVDLEKGMNLSKLSDEDKRALQSEVQLTIYGVHTKGKYVFHVVTPGDIDQVW